MPAREVGPPYFLVFMDPKPGAAPLMISVDERPALPLFDSSERTEAFLASADFGPGWRPVEVSGAGLLAVLEASRGKVEYVALNPPPATRGGMRVEMGRLGELIEALRQSPEDDLFGLGSDGSLR